MMNVPTSVIKTYAQLERLLSSSSVMFRKLKHYKRSGEGGPRAVGAQPISATAGFCCVLKLFEYFTKFPGIQDTLALTAHSANGVPWQDIRVLCHCAAVESGLDPPRLLPHSLRVQVQLERRKQQGEWNSETRMQTSQPDAYSMITRSLRAKGPGKGGSNRDRKKVPLCLLGPLDL